MLSALGSIVDFVVELAMTFLIVSQKQQQSVLSLGFQSWKSTIDSSWEGFANGTRTK